MNNTPKYVKEVQELLARHDEDNQEPINQGTPYKDDQAVPPDQELIFDVWSIPGKKGTKGFIVLQPDEDAEIIDSILTEKEPDTNIPQAPTKQLPTPQPVTSAMIGVLLLAMFLPIFCIALQFYFIANPYTVTVTLLAKSQQLSLTGTLQLGRVISPFTLSQSQTVPTTGKGHQDAKQATGFITFYNGLFSEQTVASGTILTGSDGVQIVTDADANIPAENGSIPPTLGQATVSAHAVTPGSAGNIPTGDINQPCCATAVRAVNTTSFSGGADERNFQTVAKSDITNVAAPLKGTVTQSMQTTLTGQLKSGETLTSPTCATSQTADHQAGEEATAVKVSVSETCSGIAYNSQELTDKVTQLLTSQAMKKFGIGYSLFDPPQVDIKAAEINHTATPLLVFLSFTAQSTWIYGISTQEQQTIKTLIAGKTTAKALQLLAALPGIELVALQSSGFGDSSQIPKARSSIQLALFYG